jgi:hypothetical protein
MRGYSVFVLRIKKLRLPGTKLQSWWQSLLCFLALENS